MFRLLILVYITPRCANPSNTSSSVFWKRLLITFGFWSDAERVSGDGAPLLFPRVVVPSLGRSEISGFTRAEDARTLCFSCMSVRPEWISSSSHLHFTFLFPKTRRSKFTSAAKVYAQMLHSQPYRLVLTYLYYRLLISARRECGQTLQMPRK